MQNNLNAQNELMSRRLKFAKVGMLIALLSGIGQALNGSMTGLASGLWPVTDPSYTVITIVICSFICSGLHDFFSGCWILIWNKASRRSITEYIRLLKTKLGWLLMVGALLGGPVATGGAAAATYLCGPTYSLAISGIYPLIGVLCGVIFLKEKLTVRSGIGIVIAVAGVLIMSFSPPSGESFPYFTIGLMFAFLCAIGWGTEGVVAAYANDMLDPNISVGTFRSFGSGLFMLLIIIPLVGLFGGVGAGKGFEILGEAVGQGTPVLIMVIAALGGGSSMYFFYQALNSCGISRTMCINITSSIWSIPICLILEAMGFMEYEITTRAIIGAVVIVSGSIVALAKTDQQDLVSLRKGN